LHSADINSQSLSAGDTAFIDSLLSSNYPDNSAGINFIVTIDGKPVYRKSFGMSDIEAGKKLSPEDVMPIGSMSKQFAAVSLLKLVDQGKLSLHDNITKYLPDYDTHGSTITVENLLTHSSGIPSYTELKGFMELYKKQTGKEDMVKFFESEPLVFQPATNWSYSNSGYFLISMIVEKVSGKSYSDFVMDNILLPLKMNDTYLGWSTSSPLPPTPKGYEPGDGESMTPSEGIFWSWTIGAGDVLSTVDDLAKWDAALYSGIGIKDEILNKAWTPYILSNGENSYYGYGWSISKTGGKTFVSHGGAITGFLSQGIRIPEDRIYIAALSNNMSKDPSAFADRIALRLAGIDINDPVALSLNNDELQKYTGVYEMNRSGGRVTANYGDQKMYRYITESNGELYVQSSGGSKSKLIPFANAEFFGEKSKTRYIFSEDASGRITSVTLRSYPFQLGPVEIARKTELPLPEEKKDIEITESLVKDYLGTYELMPGFNLEFLFEDGKFKVLPTGQSKEELFADSESKFYLKIVDATFEFKRGDDGKVNSVILTQGQIYECKKVK
jgi:CubicO group peptidase (beta-lactamase class C family)